MIKVVYNDNFKNLKITGHAGYADKGKDIVCASATTIIVYSLNLIEKLGLKITYQLEEGYSKLVNDANSEIVDKIRLCGGLKH